MFLALREYALVDEESASQVASSRSRRWLMEVSAWTNGSGTYGIRIGFPNRDQFFQPAWSEIEVEIDGQCHLFQLTEGFWHHCPEFRDSGSVVICDWLQRHRTLDWPKGQPPRFELIPLGGNRFRLVG